MLFRCNFNLNGVMKAVDKNRYCALCSHSLLRSLWVSFSFNRLHATALLKNLGVRCIPWHKS